MRPALTILTILCLALGAALLVRHKKAVTQEQTDQARILTLSNELVKASTERDDQHKISLLLETNLIITSMELSSSSNSLVKTSADLEKAKAEAKAAADAFQAEMKKRDAKIAELEHENTALEKQSDDLRTSITGLEKAIVDTEKKLASSEGDREFLLKELKRLQAEKTELERQFNDLAELRKQVSRLKEELSIARRIEWLKKGIFGFSDAKGGQLLMQTGNKPATAPKAATGTNFGLQAELRSDGSATVTTPKPATPAPAPRSGSTGRRADSPGGQAARPPCSQAAHSATTFPGERATSRRPGAGRSEVSVSASPLVDSHGRVLGDLRISVTDRCNFRCLYCLPETEAAQNFYRGRWATLPNPKPIARTWVAKSHLLSFEEIERFARLAVSRGIRKLRVTGGEPLLRQELEKLVGMLARIEGVEDLAMTTNGFAFADKARALKDAGLRRISFSLDSLDRANFIKMTGRDGLESVLKGIRMAQDLGLNPVKVNAVVIRGINDHELEALAEFGCRSGISLRFIEFMPLDSARAWQKDLVVSGREILKRLQARFTLEPVKTDHPSETAKRWRVAGDAGGGEIGIIAPVSEPFCGHCNRLRLTADGKIRTCLFSIPEHDVRDRMRAGISDADLSDYLTSVVWQKEDRHHIGEPQFVSPERSMSCIGG